MAKVNFEGNAQLGINLIYCVCECGHHENENAIIEFNFREQKVFFRCPKCKKNNELIFAEALQKQMQTASYPRAKMGSI